MVELQETSTILRSASSHSLVIMDELGRGTSTFDGYAIAFGTLKYVAETIGCCTLFSTHYHMLIDEFISHPFVSNYHMACHIDEELKKVTFLYQLVEGGCRTSHGMNVARLAGIAPEIVSHAERVAQQFEAVTSHLLSFRVKEQKFRDVIKLLQSLQPTPDVNSSSQILQSLKQLQTRNDSRNHE